MSSKAKFPIFFKDPVALAKDDARRSYITLPKNYKFASKTNSIPLAVTEFEIACRSYPIVFTSGNIVAPVVIVGLEADQNLFVDEQCAWLTNVYVPAYVRKYPFVFNKSEKEDLLTLCADSEYLSDPDTGTPIFRDGKPNNEISKALEFCKNFHTAWLQTENFSRVLRDNDLLTEKRADIEMYTGKKMSLDGFSVIDRDKFDNLIKTEEGQYPFTSSQIAAVYAHFVSLNNWQSLINMKTLEAQAPGEKE